MRSQLDIPLCVDLDGTLVKSDMLFECALQLLKKNPLILLQMLLWLGRGKAVLKREIVSRVVLTSEMFPYNSDVLEFVRMQKSNRKTVLVTGSDQAIADYVAKETNLFEIARGSDGFKNLTSTNKCDWLVAEFGAGGFDYIGNDSDDVVVWAESNKALLAGDKSTQSRFSGTTFEHVFDVPKPNLADYLSLLRVHQWSKNALIFIPFLLDKTIQTWPNLLIVILSFFAMSLMASMTYIVNDMLDLTADRANATKKERALASCRMPLKTGVFAAVTLLVILIVLAFMLPFAFNGILLLYLLTTLYYSFYLKTRLILDVCTIAVLHTLRIVAGTVAVNAIWSFWLLAFSMFVFFSLAVAKRVSELTNLKQAGRANVIGRGYQVDDIPMLCSIGVSTGYISVLVIALFVNSEKVAANYSQPVLLWLLCPLLMYWIGRLWVITARGGLHEDPIIFAVKDRVSNLVVIALGVVVASASFL